MTLSLSGLLCTILLCICFSGIWFFKVDANALALFSWFSSAGTSTTPSTTTPSTTPSTTTPSTTPSTTTPSTTTPSTTSPYTGTPSTGVYGGINSGVGPSGAGINTDISHGGFMLQNTCMFSFFITLWFSGLMLLWG